MDTNKAFALAQNMMNDHGLIGWRVAHRNYKSTGAVTYFSSKTIGFSAALIAKWTEDEFRQIVLHEIAHALVGHGHGHDRVWAAKARSIGYTGGRTHSLPTAEHRWIVDCPECGVLGRRHNRARRAMFCGVCKSQVRFVEAKAKAAAV